MRKRERLPKQQRGGTRKSQEVNEGMSVLQQACTARLQRLELQVWACCLCPELSSPAAEAADRNHCQLINVAMAS